MAITFVLLPGFARMIFFLQQSVLNVCLMHQ